MADEIGPWKRADIRTLADVCENALRLNEPRYSGLMAGPPNRFESAAAAKLALHAHPIYQWLNTHAALALAIPGDEFALVRTLLRGMTIAFAEQQEPASKPDLRTDKKRITAVRATERIMDCLDDGTIVMGNLEKNKMLHQLLYEARNGMQAVKLKPVKHPALAALVGFLHRQFRVTDVTIFMAIVAAMEITDCDERTVRRYIKAAADA